MSDTKVVDGMKYEQTKVKKPRQWRVKQAQNIVSARDYKVLGAMPTSTIAWYLAKKHSTGIWIMISAVLFVVAFGQFLVN